MLKLFKNDKGVHAAVKRLAMHLMEYSIVYVDERKSGYTAEFMVDNIEDYDEIENRGFKVKLEEGLF